MLRIHDELFEIADPGLPAALASIYGSKVRPVCTCRNVEMYIAKVSGKYAVKRMPNTGPDHSPGCDSYEPPAELSGLGQVIGTAIEEDADEGMTTLKLGFSLSKVSGKKAPSPSTGEKDSVKTDGNKLTLRGTLHYLWDQAGFTRWSPAMENKRSWPVIRKYLLLAAENKMTKGSALVDRLYIPEPFSEDRKSEIAQRRMAQLAKASAPAKETRQLMIVIGEIKEIGTARFGFKIRFKHVPDCDFMMNEDLHKRLRKRFATEIELWSSNADNGVHLMAIATFSVGHTGVPSIEEIALMVVSPGWVPFENQFELMLLNSLTEKKRRFVKGLRYNLASTTPLACAVLQDTHPQPTALYVTPFGASEEFVAALDELIAQSKLSSWKWDPASGEMNTLPSPGAAGALQHRQTQHPVVSEA
ncbi:DUF1173 domain-containing protein [Massilia sp.]|uniref:DUF1173 domain-containing protein n=1 Tax=Massilia sp. TaxID=1882437 RepID=UPI00352D41CF